jgi:hypothetical protein
LWTEERSAAKRPWSAQCSDGITSRKNVPAAKVESQIPYKISVQTTQIDPKIINKLCVNFVKDFYRLRLRDAEVYWRRYMAGLIRHFEAGGST